MDEFYDCMRKLGGTLHLIEAELSYLEDELTLLEDFHSYKRGLSLFTFLQDEPSSSTDIDGGLSKSTSANRCIQIVESVGKL